MSSAVRLKLRDIDPAKLYVPDAAGRWYLEACFDVKANQSRLQNSGQTGLSLQNCCWSRDEAWDVMRTNIRKGAVI